MIRKLDAKAVSKLRSSLFTTSLAQIGVELLQNSIDAGASEVDILVNIAEKSIQVNDDGLGIPNESFKLLGQRSVFNSVLSLITHLGMM
jgi:DNA mismatch repair protein MLH3